MDVVEDATFVMSISVQRKDMPLERLQKSGYNLRYGFDSIWLQSDEMLLYGCDSKEFVLTLTQF